MEKEATAQETLEPQSISGVSVSFMTVGNGTGTSVTNTVNRSQASPIIVVRDTVNLEVRNLPLLMIHCWEQLGVIYIAPPNPIAITYSLALIKVISCEAVLAIIKCCI